MATELAAAYVTIIPSLKGAGKTIEKALSGIDTTSTGQSWGKSIADGMIKAASVGVKSIGAIGAAIGGLAIGGGISRALKLDEAEFKFKAMGIDVEKAMKSCNEAVTGTAFGLDAAATVASQLGASGVKAGEQMTEALKGAAGMAAMGGVSLERVGMVYAKVAAQGKLQGDELMQFSEMGVNALGALADYFGVTQQAAREMVKNGEVDFAEFSAAMNKMYGDAAKGANETFSGAMANVGAALSRIGAKFASPALDGLRRVFVALIPAIDTVSKLLDPLVERFTAFVDTVAGRSVAGIEAFTKTLNDTGSVMSAFKAMLAETFEGTAIGSFIGRINGFFAAVRAGTSPIALLKAYWQDFISSVSNTNILDTIREKIANLPAPVQNVISALSSFGSKVAEVFSGINVNGAAVAAVFAGIMLAFGGPLKTVATALAAFGGKIGGVFKTISGYGGIVSFITTKIATLGSAIAFAGGPLGFAVSLFNKAKIALMGLLSPVNLVMVGIAALAAVFAYLMTTNEGFRNTIMNLVAAIGTSLAPIIMVIGQALSNLASTVLPLISNLIAALVPVIGQVIVVIMQVIAAIAPIITTLVSVLIPIITSLIQIIITAATAIIGAVLPVISIILSAIQTAMPIIRTIITTVMLAIQMIIQAVWPVIQGIIQTVVSVVLSLIRSAMPTIKSIIQTVMSVILSIIQKVWPTVQRIIETAVKVIQAVVQVAWPVIQNIIQSVMGIIQGIIQGAWPVIQSIITLAMANIQGVINTVWPIISGVINAAMSLIQGIVNAGMAIVKGDWEGAWDIIKNALFAAWDSIISGVQTGIDNLMSWIGKIPGMVKGFFADAGSWLLDAGKSIISGLWSGIESAMSGLGEKLAGVGDFIAAHKGPKQYDLKLLVPNGQWIMQSLIAGINSSIPALQSALAGVSSSVQGFGSDIMPFDDASANIKTWRNVEFREDSAGTVDEVLALLSDYLPEMAKEKQVVMDDGTLVGALAPKMDKALGTRNKRRSKGL